MEPVIEVDCPRCGLKFECDRGHFIGVCVACPRCKWLGVVEIVWYPLEEQPYKELKDGIGLEHKGFKDDSGG